jgi:GNAT superfamily N-acetyltransferase
MRTKLEEAAPEDAEEIASLRNAAAVQLTAMHGKGGWSSCVSDKGVLNGMRTGRCLVLRRRGRIVATLMLSTSKPWAIDVSYYTPSDAPLYVTGMAVAPDLQRGGMGRHCMKEVERLARAWPADVVRLDAYEGPAGAGTFYEKCGYREVGRVVYRTVPLIYFELVLGADPSAEVVARPREKVSAR